jgi:hypothetical protein
MASGAKTACLELLRDKISGERVQTSRNEDPPLAARPRRTAARGAALFSLATLIVGLAAGYALGDRHSGQPSRLAPPAASAPSAPGADDLFGLAQTGERPNRR